MLLGSAFYGPAIDLWSLGCVFAELMLRVPYFAAESELDQLSKIFEALGTPTEKDWPVSFLPSSFSLHVAESCGGLLVWLFICLFD